MSWQVPLTDVVMEETDVAAVIECLQSGWLTMGPRTKELEVRFEELIGVHHAVAVSSGTAALHLALLAAGVGQGDEVILPALTFVAGAAAVRYCGANPVFADSVGTHDLNLDPRRVAELIGPRTRAVLTTHWMGYACDLPALEQLCRQHELTLIEDCAQSITATDRQGRQTGTVGSLGCFSLFSKKQLCVGEGGMVTTSDRDLAEKVASLRSHAMTTLTWERHRGHAESYDIVDVGFNFRIDEPRATLALSRLPRLNRDIEARRRHVRRYREALSRLPEVEVPWTDEEVGRSAHFGFPVILADSSERSRVEHELNERGIQTTCYPAITQLSAYMEHPACPVSEDLASRHLLLPLAAAFGDEQIDTVLDALTEVMAPGERSPT